MRSDRRVRRLVVDEETVYLWSFRHRHDRRGPGGADCRHVLSLYREGGRTRTAIMFRAGPGRIISEGYWQNGTVVDARRDWINLYEPGTVRRLVDEATRRGQLPGLGGELDGWELLETLTATAGPGLEPAVSPHRGDHP
jgi:hypothetical protein